MGNNEGAIKRLRKNFMGSDKLSKRKRNNLIALAAANLATGTFFSEVIGSFLQFYYTEFLLMSAATVSLVLSVGIFVDGLSDVAMGAILDRFENKRGKIKSWLIWASIPTAVATVLIFMCPESLSEGGKLAYLFITYNVYSLFLTAVRMPGSTIISMGFRDPEARQVAGVANGLFSQLGQLVVTSGMPVLIAALGSTAAAYQITNGVFSSIGVLFCLLAYATLKEVHGSKASIEHVRETEGAEAGDIAQKVYDQEKSAPGEKKKNRNLLADLKKLVSNKYWLLMQIVGMANNVGIGFMFGVAAYFTTYILGNMAYLGAIYGTLSIGMMCGIFMAAPLIVKLDSRFVGILGSFVAALGMGIAAIGIMVMGKNMTVFYAGLFIRQLGTGCLMAIQNDITARVIDYGEWRDGIRLDGLTFSGTSVMGKIMSALATALLGFILTATGYVGGAATLAPSAVSAIQILFLVVPGVACAVGGISYIFFDLSNVKIIKIREEIAERAKNAI